MTSDTLFLITKTYPFGHGEQYITNELKYLSLVFKRIIIYPNDYYQKEIEHHKELPTNVEILNFNQKLSISNKNNVADYLYLLRHTILEFFLTDDKINFFRNFKWNLINFWTQYQISKHLSVFIKKNNYSSNCIFYSYWFHKSAILLSILKDKKYIQKFVSRAHSVDLYHQDWGIINEQIKVPPFKMFKLKHSTAIFPVSKHGTDYLKNKYPAYSKKIKTHYLGVMNNQVLSNFPINNNMFHIVTCSGIDLNKRVHKLAEALLQIKHQVLWTHFGNGNLLHKLEETIKQLPKNITVHLKGNTPNQEIQTFYKEENINLFVNLSIVEGLPVSIMEAMSHSIPILATNVYGTPEAVNNQENGLLIDVDFTLGELEQKLNYCIENKDLLYKMGLNSKGMYLEKFNAEKNYLQFANNLASL